MVSTLCKLTIITPRDVKTKLADVLDEMSDVIEGYTVLDGQGRGAAAELSSPAERVEGAMKIALFMMVLPEDAAEAVLDRIAGHCQRRKLTFWKEPVSDFGRLL